MKNQHAFNRAVADVLANLLDEFPNEVRLLDLNKAYPDADADTIQLYASTIEFLAREGFITARRVSSNAPLYGNMGLTLRGLTVLNAVPESVTDKETWGDKVKAAAKFGGKETVSAVIPQLLSRRTGDSLSRFLAAHYNASMKRSESDDKRIASAPI